MPRANQDDWIGFADLFEDGVFGEFERRVLEDIVLWHSPPKPPPIFPDTNSAIHELEAESQMATQAGTREKPAWLAYRTEESLSYEMPDPTFVREEAANEQKQAEIEAELDVIEQRIALWRRSLSGLSYRNPNWNTTKRDRERSERHKYLLDQHFKPITEHIIDIVVGGSRFRKKKTGNFATVGKALGIKPATVRKVFIYAIKLYAVKFFGRCTLFHIPPKRSKPVKIRNTTAHKVSVERHWKEWHREPSQIDSPASTKALTERNRPTSRRQVRAVRRVMRNALARTSSPSKLLKNRPASSECGGGSVSRFLSRKVTSR